MDKVGLSLLEHIGGHVPFPHDELMRDVEFVEHKVEHIDVVPGGLSLRVYELKGLEVPVADNNQRFLLCVAEIVGGREEG